MSIDEIEGLIGDVNIGNFPVEPHHMQILNNEDVILKEGTLYYDIRFFLDIKDSHLEVRLYMDIEAQNKTNPDYPIVTKGIVYSSRMISQQYGIEYDYQSYGKLKKVYSIWIMPQAAKYMDGNVNTYEIDEKQVIGDYHEDAENYDKMSIILVYLSNKHEIEKKYEKYDEILTPLSVLLTNNIKEANKKKEIMEGYGFQLSETMKKEMRDMCNLGDGIEQEAIERTTKEVTKMHVKSLVEYGLTEVQAMDILKLSPEERNDLLKEYV